MVIENSYWLLLCLKNFLFNGCNILLASRTWFKVIGMIPPYLWLLLLLGMPPRYILTELKDVAILLTSAHFNLYSIVYEMVF